MLGAENRDHHRARHTRRIRGDAGARSLLHRALARHHTEAAKHHEAGQHEKAAHHAQNARAQATYAREHSENAAKAHFEEHGKK